MDTTAKKKVQLKEILTIADHLRPLQILSVVARGGKAVSYDVTYAEDKKQKHLLLRSFCANSAEYEHLCRLHAKLGKASHIAKPLYMEDGWLLYDVDPQKQLSEKDFTEQGGKKRSRDDLKAQLDLVRKAALAVNALIERGVYMQTPDLKRMVKIADGKLCFWNLDGAQLLEATTKEAINSVQKNIAFLGKLLSMTVLRSLPAYEKFTPEDFDQSDLANAVIGELCTLLSTQEIEMLLQILKNCLCPQSGYAAAEQMAADLSKLQKKLSKEVRGPKAQKNLEWAVANFLYDNPLYPYVRAEEKVLNVVLISEGPMRDVFFEQIFASAQMLDVQLRFHIFSAKADDFDFNYTWEQAEKTPGLARAVTVTRVGYEACGKPLDPHMIGENKPLAEIVLYKKTRLPKAQELMALQPGCVLLFQKMTKGLRSLAKELIDLQDAPMLVAMATEQELDRSGLGKNKNISLRKFSRNGLTMHSAQWEASRIYKRALNIHTYYEKDADERKSKQEILAHFEDMYSMRSSLRSALAMPYKLYACGLQDDEDSAIAFFEKYINKHYDDAMMNRLIWLEHRSWQAFLLVSGWDILRVEDLEKRLFDSDNLCHDHRDKAKLLHPCLYASWDKPEAQIPEKPWEAGDISGLDPLDRLSVQMHRMFSRRVKETTEKEFESCLRELKNAPGKVSLHALKQLEVTFSLLLSKATNADIAWHSTLNELKPSLEENTYRQLASLGDVVIKRNEYRNFKSSDLAVIEAIPKMLCNTAVSSVYKLYAPKLWDNVASSVYIEPEQLVLVADESCIKEAKRNLIAFAKFLKMRNLDTQISVISPEELGGVTEHAVLDVSGIGAQHVYMAQKHHVLSKLPVICYNGQKLQSPDNSFRQIQLYQSKRSLNVEEMLTLGGAYIYEAEDALLGMDRHQELWQAAQACSENQEPFYNQAIAELQQYTSSVNKARKWDLYVEDAERQAVMEITEAVAEKTGVSELLRELEKKEVINRIKLRKTDDALCVTAKDPYCQRALNALLGDVAKKISSKQIKFAFEVKWDYMREMYVVRETGSWKKKWDIAREATFWQTNLALEEAKECGLYDFLQNLEMQNGIKPLKGWGEGKNGCTTVIAKEPLLQKKLGVFLGQLFTRGTRYRAYSVSVDHDLEANYIKSIRVSEQTLECKKEDVSGSESFAALMEKLEAYGFVKPIDTELPVYSRETKYLQFAYASENCRASLRAHGNVLEVFAYHTIRQMNIFDDVKLSVKIRWDKDIHQETETENEIDLICTKGTKSYFISCKKKNSVDTSCLTEIRYEADRFGVDGTPILLTTAKRDKNLSTYNRAAQMGIPVIVLCDYIGKGKTKEDSGAVLRKELLKILGD